MLIGQSRALPRPLPAVRCIGTVGSRRYRALARALERGEPAPLAPTTVTLFTVGGVVLATVTTVVVLAEI